MGDKIKKMKEDAGKSDQNIGMGRAWERYELTIYVSGTVLKHFIYIIFLFSHHNNLSS